MKINKSIISTGLFSSTIGPVGCSSSTSDVNNSVEVNKEVNKPFEGKKDILDKYLYKSGLKVNVISYEDTDEV